MQLDFPLERLKRKNLIYDEGRFIEEVNQLLKKGLLHKLEVSPEFLALITSDYLGHLKEDKILSHKLQSVHGDGWKRLGG